jgi:ParB/RepB/Spo0J family partition protein
MKVDPKTILIRSGLERFRKELGDISELANSIKTKGQLQPIVVNEQMELIAGGRRLAACLQYDMEVEIKIINETDSLSMRELEVEENIQRLDFTPAEHVLAVKELHELKMALNPGVTIPTTWSIQDTANFIGMDRSSVSKDLSLAEMVTAFPSLSKCKTKQELRTAASSLMKLLDRAGSIGDYERILETSERVTLYNMEADEFLASIPSNTVDLFFCDPPYGIEVFENAIGIGGETGNTSTLAGFTYDDSKQAAFSLIKTICKESFRVCKDTAHFYMFCGPEFFHEVSVLLQKAKWQVSVKPIIWSKPGQGQANAPECWPVSSYEMLIYARKQNSKLIYARSDVLTYNRVPSGERVHPSQKPLDLIRDLITRCVNPGATLLDPCTGSGASLVAGLQERLICKGNDKLYTAYTAAMQYIDTELKKEVQNVEV